MIKYCCPPGLAPFPFAAVSDPSLFIKMLYAEYFDVSPDRIFGRTDKPHGLYPQNKPTIEKSCPETDRFTGMCFE